MGTTARQTASPKTNRHYRRRAKTRIVVNDADNCYVASVAIYDLEPAEVEQRLLRMRKANGCSRGTSPADVPPG